MIALPRNISPTSRIVAATIDQLYGYPREELVWIDAPQHPLSVYSHRLRRIGDEIIAEPLRSLGETYQGMPIAAFLKSCEKHNFRLDSFPVSINQGGTVQVLLRESDGGMIVGYAQNDSMCSGAFFRSRLCQTNGFTTESFDCLNACGLLMDIHTHCDSHLETEWNDSQRDQTNTMALLCPISEFKSHISDYENPKPFWQYIQDICCMRADALPNPWREMFKSILITPSANF
jgi:hypothetical protein